MAVAEDIREHVTDWFTSADTCFLLGAGCGKCAGKPLIRELTEQVLCEADESLKEQFNNLKPSASRPATIEDLMNYLEQYYEILSSIENTDSHNLRIEDIAEWLQYIKKQIVERIDATWKANPDHERFLQRLCGSESKCPRDIFCLNYDTVLEASLDNIRVPYIDGFRGTVRGWFDARVFDESERMAKFRIFKLHGSVSWVEDGDYVRRRTSASGEPVVVYPSGDKRIQTQYGIYELLMERFRKQLRNSAANSRLITLGYSFNDDHINRAIFDAIGTYGNNLTVIAFVGKEKDDPSCQERRFRELSENADQRFNVFLGGGSKDESMYLGNIVDEMMGNDICGLRLWRFEQLVDYIT